jgi:predicted chitinase
MALITKDQLVKLFPKLGLLKAENYALLLDKAMLEGAINTKLRICHFLAQIGHESLYLTALTEFADGKAYEGRKDLGNIQPGDGPRFKGRGFIQITGRANYKAAGQAIGLDLENNPLLAADPGNAFRIAVWYWNSRKLNERADQNDIVTITKRINGAATKGPPSYLDMRQTIFNKAWNIL